MPTLARSRHKHSTAPVQRIDTHSTLLTPEPRKEPELILSSPVFHRDVAPFSGNDYRDLGRFIMEV